MSVIILYVAAPPQVAADSHGRPDRRLFGESQTPSVNHDVNCRIDDVRTQTSHGRSAHFVSDVVVARGRSQPRPQPWLPPQASNSNVVDSQRSQALLSPGDDLALDRARMAKSHAQHRTDAA